MLNGTARLVNPRSDSVAEAEKKMGSTFSVGYNVEKKRLTAFLKIFDIVSVFQRDRNLLDELKLALNCLYP